MATATDYQLIQRVQLGDQEALGHLYDRYGDDLYDFLVAITGDADQSADLLANVFVRVPQATYNFQPHESLRGVLYSLAYENALAFLRQKSWLEALPYSTLEGPGVPDLVNDIWQAARVLPATQRAVLALEERQALSPTEKATALGVVRNAYPDLVIEARNAFRYRFNVQAQAAGKPTLDLIDPTHIPGLQKRIPEPDTSLFAYLPVFVMTDALRLQIRQRIVGVTEIVREEPVILPPPIITPPPVEPRDNRPAAVILIVIAVLIIFLAILLTAFFGFGPTQARSNDTIAPIIQQVLPANNSIVPAGQRIVVEALYSDNQKIDIPSVQLVFDGRDVTPLSTISESSISYVINPDPGQHTAVVALKDVAGNRSTQTWSFTVSPVPASPTAILAPSPTAAPTSTLLPTPTNAPTWTPMPTPTNAPTQTPVPTPTHAPTATPAPSPTTAPTVAPSPTTAPTIAPSPTTAPALADLIVTNISLGPNAEIIYVIRNNGNGDATLPFLIQVLVDNNIIDSNRKITSLGAGQEISLFVPNYTLTGTHTVAVIVNADQTVRESNYNNNQLIRTLTGPAPTVTPTK